MKTAKDRQTAEEKGSKTTEVCCKHIAGSLRPFFESGLDEVWTNFMKSSG